VQLPHIEAQVSISPEGYVDDFAVTVSTYFGGSSSRRA
jgi:hypothetical protein